MVLLDASFSKGLQALGESVRSIRLCAWSLCWLLHPRENLIVRVTFEAFGYIPTRRLDALGSFAPTPGRRKEGFAMSLTMREQEIIGMMTKGFSQQGNRPPVDIELSTT